MQVGTGDVPVPPNGDGAFELALLANPILAQTIGRVGARRTASPATIAPFFGITCYEHGQVSDACGALALCDSTGRCGPDVVNAAEAVLQYRHGDRSACDHRQICIVSYNHRLVKDNAIVVDAAVELDEVVQRSIACAVSSPLFREGGTGGATVGPRGDG